MMQYKLIKDKPDQVMYINGDWHGIIPFEVGNRDYETYLKWLDGYEQQFNVEEQKMEWVKTSNGNTPLPADE